MVGTPEYMSPEVLQGMARKWSKQDVKGQSYDAAAADVWSVGVVLYGAATGQPLLNRFDSPARMADAEINENELSWDDLQYVMQCQTELLVSNAVVCTAQATYCFLAVS
jgi:serine/threonine protein kinase